MIRLVCDKCERPIGVPEEMAGQKFACPNCGDVNLVPLVAVGHAPAGAAAAPKAPDRAAAAGLPPDSGPEETVLKVRPAMLRARPGLFLLMFVLMVGGAGLAVWGAAVANPAQTMLAWAGVVVCVIGFIGLAVWWVLTHSVSLEVTNKRTIRREGILSRASTEVLHDDIKNFQVQQSFWERVWGVGRIGISSSGQDGIEITARDIPRPGRIKEIIDLYRPL